METYCRVCGQALCDDDNVVRDSYGVNCEMHVACLESLFAKSSPPARQESAHE